MNCRVSRPLQGTTRGLGNELELTRMQAVLSSAGKEGRDIVFDKVGPKFGDMVRAIPARAPIKPRAATRAGTQRTPARKKRAIRDSSQPGDDLILSTRDGALEVMNDIAGRSDAQKELTAEVERAALEALLTRAVQVLPPSKDDWHAASHAEQLKAFAAADWLIHSDEITRRQIADRRAAHRGQPPGR